MKFNKVAILTAKESWFVPYAQELVTLLRNKDYRTKLFFRYNDIPKNYEVVFILSYFKIIEKRELSKHKFNFVVHESNLPNGKGWAPLFWQILEGKNKIPIVLFEASDRIDSGKIYFRDFIILKSHELHDEIRALQVKKTMDICIKLLKNFDNIKPQDQKGKETYYKRRTPQDSKLDINKTIKEQFNRLRIADNKRFPAFFYHKGYKYTIKVYKEN